MPIKRTHLILLLILFSLGITFICQKDALFNKYIVHDDTNMYLFPFYSIQDPQLFQDDLLSAYALCHNSLGMVFIYTFLCRFSDPLVLSKIFPFVLCCLSAVYFFLVGEKIKNIYVGSLAAVIFTMYSWTLQCFSGGHARAFAFLFLSSFIYYLLVKRYLAVILILLLEVFIYPPLAVLSVTALALKLFFRPLRDKGWIDSVVVIAVGVSLLAFIYLVPHDFPGPVFAWKDITHMPEFFKGGRTPIFIDSLEMLRNESIAERVTGIPLGNAATWLLLWVSCFGAYLTLKKKIDLGPWIGVFVLAGFLTYGLAWGFLLKLFFPGRYLKFSLSLFLIFLTALTLDRFFIESSAPERRFFKFCVVSAVAFLLAFPFLNHDLTHFRNKRLYDFLSTLPKDAVIAGHPQDANEIPLFAKRKVFLTYELSLPLHHNYYNDIRNRTDDLFRLYYAGSASLIKKMCAAEHIDYLLVRPARFSRDYLNKKEFYIDPYNAFVRRIVAANEKSGFVLARIPQSYKLYEDADFYVIKISEIQG